MAKQQEFITLFPKYDIDQDGEINQQEFIDLVTELQLPSIYPGSVAKMIRKLNYSNSEKITINFEQAKEYYNSFQTPTKHEIWKAKYTLLAETYQLKLQFDGKIQEDSAAPAAPGSQIPKEQPEKNPVQARINILVGPSKTAYNSQINLQFQKIEKIEKNDKSKPFLKLTITSKTNERAKLLEKVFKEQYNGFISLLGHDLPEWVDEFKNIHLNSFVNDLTTTFFITSANDDVIEYINLATQFFELIYNLQLTNNGHIKFQFDYDFEKFIQNDGSSFYDIFTKDCKLSLDLSCLNLLKSLKKTFKQSVKNDYYQDPIEVLIPLSLLHLQNVEGDFQFENSSIEEYETETKQQLKNLLKKLGEFFNQLDQGGNMAIRSLIELLDDTITIEANAGEWRVKSFIRLKNFNKIFTELTKIQVHPSEEGTTAQNDELGQVKLTVISSQKHPTPDLSQKSSDSD